MNCQGTPSTGTGLGEKERSVHTSLGIHQDSHKHLSQVTAGEIPHRSQICPSVTMNKVPPTAPRRYEVAAPIPTHDRLSQKEEMLPKPDYTSRKRAGICPLRRTNSLHIMQTKCPYLPPALPGVPPPCLHQVTGNFNITPVLPGPYFYRHINLGFRA